MKTKLMLIAIVSMIAVSVSASVFTTAHNSSTVSSAVITANAQGGFAVYSIFARSLTTTNVVTVNIGAAAGVTTSYSFYTAIPLDANGQLSLSSAGAYPILKLARNYMVQLQTAGVSYLAVTGEID